MNAKCANERACRPTLARAGAAQAEPRQWRRGHSQVRAWKRPVRARVSAARGALGARAVGETARSRCQVSRVPACGVLAVLGSPHAVRVHRHGRASAPVLLHGSRVRHAPGAGAVHAAVRRAGWHVLGHGRQHGLRARVERAGARAPRSRSRYSRAARACEPRSPVPRSRTSAVRACRRKIALQRLLSTRGEPRGP